ECTEETVKPQRRRATETERRKGNRSAARVRILLTLVKMEPELDRYIGCLVGLAIGDALGTTLEFRPKGSFKPITEMVGGGPFGLRPGQWTDDTSMALCLAESLVERRGFDAADQMRRYVRWWHEGYRSSRPGDCFDIGNAVSAALRRFERSGDPFAGSTDPQTAGNGSLMRLAPVPMFYCNDPREAVVRAAESSKTTHAATEAVDACRYYAALVVAACCLTACGAEPDAAIRCVREARPGAVETKAQERFVARFAKAWEELRADRGADDAGKPARDRHGHLTQR